MNEWELEFEAEAPESISSLMREVVDERMSARMSHQPLTMPAPAGITTMKKGAKLSMRCACVFYSAR